MSKWFFAIDKGGTFTDVIGIDPQKKIEDFDTKSTLSWALQKCARSKKKKLF